MADMQSPCQTRLLKGFAFIQWWAGHLGHSGTIPETFRTTSKHPVQVRPSIRENGIVAECPSLMIRPGESGGTLSHTPFSS